MSWTHPESTERKLRTSDALAIQLPSSSQKTEYVDFDDPSVKCLAERLRTESADELSLIKNTYHFVRDEIKHSWDAQDRRVTVSASDTLREGAGILDRFVGESVVRYKITS